MKELIYSGPCQNMQGNLGLIGKVEWRENILKGTKKKDRLERRDGVMKTRRKYQNERISRS